MHWTLRSGKNIRNYLKIPRKGHEAPRGSEKERGLWIHDLIGWLIKSVIVWFNFNGSGIFEVLWFSERKVKTSLTVLWKSPDPLDGYEQKLKTPLAVVKKSPDPLDGFVKKSRGLRLEYVMKIEVKGVWISWGVKSKGSGFFGVSSQMGLDLGFSLVASHILGRTPSQRGLDFLKNASRGSGFFEIWIKGVWTFLKKWIRKHRVEPLLLWWLRCKV